MLQQRLSVSHTPSLHTISLYAPPPFRVLPVPHLLHFLHEPVVFRIVDGRSSPLRCSRLEYKILFLLLHYRSKNSRKKSHLGSSPPFGLFRTLCPPLPSPKVPFYTHPEANDPPPLKCLKQKIPRPALLKTSRPTGLEHWCGGALRQCRL